MTEDESTTVNSNPASAKWPPAKSVKWPGREHLPSRERGWAKPDELERHTVLTDQELRMAVTALDHVKTDHAILKSSSLVSVHILNFTRYRADEHEPDWMGGVALYFRQWMCGFNYLKVTLNNGLDNTMDTVTSLRATSKLLWRVDILDDPREVVGAWNIANGKYEEILCVTTPTGAILPAGYAAEQPERN